jgi:phosphate transport system ATP-binding protein
MSKSITMQDVDIYYGSFKAVEGVTLKVEPNSVTAFIGPSGCGKSTVLRTINRMHEVIPGAKVEGTMSIAENVLAGVRLNGQRMSKSDSEAIVEKALRGANLWEEVKDRLDRPGSGLSGGQQQRLCIARAIAIEPQVVLMDEPCSALDPISTLAIEDLIRELQEKYTIIIVTHNMQQAGRVSDTTGFFNLAGVGQPGRLVEMGPTATIFSQPQEQATEDYISGRFG